MRSVIGPLLIALGPLMVVGCVLPDRSISRSEDFGFGPKISSRPSVSSEPSPDEKLTFKVPRRQSPSNKSLAGSMGGDSDQQPMGNPRFGGVNDSGRSEFVPGHSSDLPNNVHPAERWSSLPSRKVDDQQSSFDSNDGNIPRAKDRFSDDDATQLVQLQGLEFDGADVSNSRSGVQPFGWNESTGNDSIEQWAPARQRDIAADSSIQNLSDRPVDRQLESSAKSQTAAVGSIAGIKQTSHAEGPQVLAKPNAALLPPLPWQADLDQLIARVEQNMAQSKPESQADRQTEYLRKQAQLRLLYMMAQRQEEALTAIPGVAASQQEYWQQMIWALSNSFDTIQFPDADERAAQAISPLSSALRQMREEASLSIKNMAFCRKISYFGNYERFPRNEFVPGHEVLLYTEIENFVSAPTVDGEYRTSLKSQIEITDSKGKVVWTKGFPPTEDFCRNPRRDYFHNYQFHIPEDLPIGTYTLKLTIADELSHKRVSSSLNFVLK